LDDKTQNLANTTFAEIDNSVDVDDRVEKTDLLTKLSNGFKEAMSILSSQPVGGGPAPGAIGASELVQTDAGKEVGKSIVSGGIKGGVDAANMAKDAADFTGKMLNPMGNLMLQKKFKEEFGINLDNTDVVDMVMPIFGLTTNDFEMAMKEIEPDSAFGEVGSELTAFLVASSLMPGGGLTTKYKSMLKGVLGDASLSPRTGNLATMAAELGVENEFVDFLDSYMENPSETSSFERLKARVKRATTDSMIIGTAFLAATKILASKIGQIGLGGAAVTASTTEEGEASPFKTLLKGLIQKYPNVDLDVYETDKGLTLSKIVLPKENRNKGVGSKILEDLTSYADKNNLTIGVTPDSAFGGNKDKLKNFYKKFGFRNNKGINKDFTFRETMVRQPKKTNTERTEEIAKLRAEANAQKFGKNVNTSYRMQHQPNPDGARLDDMTGGGEVFPDDIYSPEGLRLYGDPKNIFDRESFDVIQSVKGKPNAEVTIYRAVPNDDKITTINRGDFVTLSPEYAKLHAEGGYGLGGKDAGKVISQKVKVKDLRSDGNDLNEFGFFPENVDD
tara:strand:- start:1388 stop:3070 length:1683 start_codon:yes stop_codon:yes gene_type:complete